MELKYKIINKLDDIHNVMILLANADDEPIRGQLKLQKMIYLLADRLDEIREQTDYGSDMLGPYSEFVDEEYNFLKDIGVFSSNPKSIFLTSEGKDVAKELAAKEKPHVIKYIQDFKKFLNDLTSNELLCFVYSAYPEMTSESVEYERLKPIMEDTLLGLVKKKKISAEKASELLNKKIEYIIKKLKDKGIQIYS